MPHWSYITEPFSLAVKYAPRSHFPPVQVCWGEIHRGYNKDNWPRVCHVSGTKYRWNRINNKIHHPHLICKTHFCPCLCKYSGRLLATLLCIGQIRDRLLVSTQGFMMRGGAEVLLVTLKIMSVSLMQTFKTWQCLFFLKLKIWHYTVAKYLYFSSRVLKYSSKWVIIVLKIL